VDEQVAFFWIEINDYTGNFHWVGAIGFAVDQVPDLIRKVKGGPLIVIRRHRCPGKGAGTQQQPKSNNDGSSSATAHNDLIDRKTSAV
jgi:hypothetical protein